LLYLIQRNNRVILVNGAINRFGNNLGAFNDSDLGPCTLFDVPERTLFQGEIELLMTAYRTPDTPPNTPLTATLSPTAHEGIMAIMLTYDDQPTPVPENNEGTSPMPAKEEKETFGRDELRRAREVYIDWMESHTSSHLKKVRRKRIEVSGDADYLQRRLTVNLREIALLDAEIKTLENLSDKPSVGYGLEFDKIVRHSKVKAVRFEDGFFHVLTDDLFIDNQRDGTFHHLGRFDISLSAGGGLKFVNLTQTIEGYSPNMHAPHVFEGGSACYGNLEEIIPSLIAAGEYASIIFMGIAFLESVDTQDAAGRYVNRWPVVSQKVVEGERPIVYLREAWPVGFSDSEDDGDEDDGDDDDDEDGEE